MIEEMTGQKLSGHSAFIYLCYSPCIRKPLPLPPYASSKRAGR